MNLESLFKLSLVMEMVDKVTKPMQAMEGQTANFFNKVQQQSGTLIKNGIAIETAGKSLAKAVLSPVFSAYETKRAISELASLGVEKLEVMEKAAEKFSNEWAGTTKAEFITAAYDIKSGIATLTDEGVSDFTRLAGITATATKSTIAEMTDLFATGYGIYKDYYHELTDQQFGEMFSGGIAKAVQQFKTSGSGMAQSIKSLGAAATAANVPFEEQLSILGMLQATMSGSEAGTKYKAFLRSAARGGKALGLSFTDANNNLLTMPEIIEKLRKKFGDTMDAAEKMQLQKAFGDAEAVALIDLMYQKTGNLQDNIVLMHSELEKGAKGAIAMADKINSADPSKMEILNQKVQNLKETIGNSLAPTVSDLIDKAGGIIEKTGEWVEKNQSLVQTFMFALLVLGGFGIGLGATIKIIGLVGFGIVQLKTGLFGFINVSNKVIRGLGFLGKGLINVSAQVLSFAKTLLINAAIATKNFVISLIGMAKQAIITAVTAMPGLIAAVWSFTAALLANPITWIILGIVALITALVLLWKNWDGVVSWIKGVWDGFVNGIIEGFNWILGLFSEMPTWLQFAIAAFMPFIGIPLLIITHWDSIKDFFVNLWNGIVNGVQQGIETVRNFLFGIPDFFRHSGEMIINTLVEGIKSVAMKPVEAVKGIFEKVRQFLPFSDAKEGPLSELTLSGNRVIQTLVTGMEQEENLPAQAMEDSFKKIDLTFSDMPERIETKKKAAISEENESLSNEKGKAGTTIEKLILNIDLKKLKELNDLIKLVEELKDSISEGDPEPVTI